MHNHYIKADMMHETVFLKGDYYLLKIVVGANKIYHWNLTWLPGILF